MNFGALGRLGATLGPPWKPKGSSMRYRTSFFWILSPNGDPNGDQKIILGGPRRPSEPPRVCFEGVFFWTSVLTSLWYPKLLQTNRFLRNARHGRNVINNISELCFSCFFCGPCFQGPFNTLFDFISAPFLETVWTRKRTEAPKTRPKDPSEGDSKKDLF